MQPKPKMPQPKLSTLLTRRYLHCLDLSSLLVQHTPLDHSEVLNGKRTYNSIEQL